MAKRTGATRAGAQSTGTKRTGTTRAGTVSKRSVADLERERQPMPAFVKQALTAHGLLGAYRARPPYQQNDYLMWINKATREDTKQKRLAQMIAELEGGTRYMKMAWRPSTPSGRRSDER